MPKTKTGRPMLRIESEILKSEILFPDILLIANFKSFVFCNLFRIIIFSGVLVKDIGISARDQGFDFLEGQIEYGSPPLRCLPGAKPR